MTQDGLSIDTLRSEADHQGRLKRMPCQASGFSLAATEGPMRVAVMGAGAVGGYVGARLAAAGEDCVRRSRGHLSAMQSAGLAVDSPSENQPFARRGDQRPLRNRARGPGTLHGKAMDIEQAAAPRAPHRQGYVRGHAAERHRQIDILSRFVAKKQIIGGVIYVAASIARPGVIKHSGGTRRVIVDAARGDAIVSLSARLRGGRSASISKRPMQSTRRSGKSSSGSSHFRQPPPSCERRLARSSAIRKHGYFSTNFSMKELR